MPDAVILSAARTPIGKLGDRVALDAAISDGLTSPFTGKHLAQEVTGD